MPSRVTRSTFDCTGNTTVMRTALEAAHRGWGTMTIIGVAAAGKEIATRPFQFITGRKCMGTAFGGWKTRDAVPMLVEKALRDEIPLKHFVTHTFKGVGGTLEVFVLAGGGEMDIDVAVDGRQVVVAQDARVIRRRQDQGRLLQPAAPQPL